jgi:hypothetical protein
MRVIVIDRSGGHPRDKNELSGVDLDRGDKKRIDLRIVTLVVNNLEV